MKYKHAAAEKSTEKITIDFTAKEWNDAIEKAYNKTKSRYTVNGFRKGKAPRSVVENFYGKGVFYEEALNELYNTYFGVIVDKEKENFTVVGEPALSVEKLSDKGVTLVALTPVKPDVTIEAYKGIKIKEYVYNVKDEDVDADVERVRDRNARKIDVTDRPAQLGDTCNIDFSGSVDGVKFDGGTADKYDLTLGSGAFIPGFEDQVVGMKIGETKDVIVTFPENYQAESLKGKTATFAVKVNSIQGKELPELTDEFIKDATGCATIDEYKAKAKERLQKQADRKGRDETENSILNAIAEKATAEIPDAMIETQIDSIMQNVEYQLMYQGLQLKDYLEYIGTSMADFRKNYVEQAKKNVMNQLIIEKIIKEEGIGATEAEIDERIAEQAKEVDKDFDEYKKNMDPRQKEYLANDVVLGKLFDFLKANNEMYMEA